MTNTILILLLLLALWIFIIDSNLHVVVTDEIERGDVLEVKIENCVERK